MSTIKQFSIIFIAISGALLIFMWIIEKQNIAELNNQIVGHSDAYVLFMKLDSGCYKGQSDTIYNDHDAAIDKMMRSTPCTFINYVMFGPGKFLVGTSFLIYLYIFFVLRVGSRKDSVENDISQKKFIRAYFITLLISLVCDGISIGYIIYGIMSWAEGSPDELFVLIIKISVIVSLSAYFMFLKYGWNLLSSNRWKVSLLTLLTLPYIVYFVIFFGAYY